MAMATLPGYAGQILRVDLSSERIWTEPIDETTARRYVGGAGLGARILYDEVPPEANWDDPENRLILATGPLAGTPVWGTGALTVVCRGALTNGATSTQANGFFGANLKYSGYDAIVFQGIANRWVYLYVNDDDVRILDADHLIGKDTWEMQDALLEEWGVSGHQMSVYGIGPAGETRVRFAAIAGDYGHVAGHNGSGAVMGAKRVKCVAIARGTKGLKVHSYKDVFETARAISHELMTNPSTQSLYHYGTLPGVVTLEAIGALPIKNYTTNVYPDKSKLDDFSAENIRKNFPHRGHQCNACGMHHCQMQTVPDGPHKGQIVDEPEYEGWSGAGATIGCTDAPQVAWLNTQIDRAGVDINEYGWLCGWVMECYEKGWLTKEQLGGLEMPWGDAEAANALLQMICRREGIGDLLAEGVKRASEAIGGEAAQAAIYTLKGATPRGHDHRGRWEEMLDTSISSVATMETGPLVDPTEIGLPARRNPFDPDETAVAMAKGLGRRHFEDSIGACIFTTRTKLALIAQAVNAATGASYDFDEAMRVGRRTAAILRAFNLRCGITDPDLERPSARYGSTPVDGPNAGIAIAPHWDRMVDLYYETVGWDRRTGRPLPETLRSLGLDDLVMDLWGTHEPVISR
ncbi:MAG TPA: aldehyde ferredoxin oxidoreductase C-terminal domain-containing protein [Dehalococcoidia bacterium]|nr:aldehyde ferredoxin oxidoreductase C-terminal domain-containing protein [Dehalococcoidia bacterium]